MPSQFDEYSKSCEKSEKNKVFIVQESLYTTLLKNDHLKSIYHMCVAGSIFLLLDNICHDLLSSGRIYLGLGTIKQGFANIHIGFAVWSLMHIPVIGLYYALQKWAQVSRNINKKVTLKKVWNYWCIISFAGFQLTLLYVSTKTCLSYDLPFILAGALLVETFRLLMKTYAFVRTNVPKFLKDKSFQLSPLSSYIYYLFAPTLIYRDSYPRTNKIRWTFVVMNLFEFIAVIFLVSFLHDKYILPNFQDFGVRKLTLTELANRVFATILPSNLILLSLAYLLLHCWLNLSGEILRFGDRMYYTGWWTSANYVNFYRTWNVVVQDWFYEFVYKDSYKNIFKGSKCCSTLLVFWVSALIHEYVVGLALQMFYPVMFFFFGVIGVIFYYTTDRLPNTIGKVFFWFSFPTGTTLITCLYAIEYFVRKNASQFDSEKWSDKKSPLPASWNLYEIFEL